MDDEFAQAVFYLQAMFSASWECVCIYSMGALKSALKNLYWFCESLSWSEAACPQPWVCLFMKLYGKAEHGVYPVGSLFPFHQVNFCVGSNPWFCSLWPQKCSPKWDERRGWKGWAPIFSDGLPLCWEKSIVELHSLCDPLIRGVPWSYCGDPEDICNWRCTSVLLNPIRVLQHEADQRALSESHSFPAQGRSCTLKKYPYWKICST